MSAMVVHKPRSAVEAWGPVSPAPAPPSPPGRPKNSPSQPQVVYHFSPAPYAVKQEIKKLTRPKSTPAQLAKVDEEFVIRAQTTDICERLEQLEYEQTRRHNFEVHLPSRRAKSAAVRKSESSLVPYHNAGGFEFSKSREKIEVKIRTEDFFNRPEPEVKLPKKNALDPAIEALIEQLQDQINDLTVYLEEERLNHRQTIKRADEILREKMELVLREHDDEVKNLKEDKEITVQKLEEKHELEMKELEKEMTAQIEKLKGEIEFLQSAFESYKTSLHTETSEKWKLREEELLNNHEEELENKLLELRTRMLNESSVDKTNILKDHAKKMERIQQDHTLEINALTQKFAKSTLELEKLTGVQKQFDDMRKAHTQLVKQHKQVTDKMSAIATELSDTKIQLLEFEASFHLKVQQVDEKYKAEIHSLMSENTELRRSYMRKCAELYDSKVKYERMINEKDAELKALKDAEKLPKKDTSEEESLLSDEEFTELKRRLTFPLTSPEMRDVECLRPLSALEGREIPAPPKKDVDHPGNDSYLQVSKTGDSGDFRTSDESQCELAKDTADKPLEVSEGGDTCEVKNEENFEIPEVHNKSDQNVDADSHSDEDEEKV